MKEYDFMSVVMYPDLKNRREFVHQCWKIAKAKENEELKKAVCSDPFFYLTISDILVLLQTHDDKTITFILELSCKLHVETDIAYKLISIKEQQVDKNQHSAVELLDFVSVMVANKRAEGKKIDDIDTEI